MNGWPIGSDLAGFVALVVLIGMQYWFTDNLIQWDRYQVLYRGGFLLTSIPTVMVIAAVRTPKSVLGRFLASEPLVWIGRRSYGIYLWHWPIFQITRPRLDLANEGWGVFTLRLGITLLLAALSFRFIECPFRERRFTKTLRIHVVDPARTVRWGAGIVVASVTLVLLVPVLTNEPASGQANERAQADVVAAARNKPAAPLAGVHQNPTALSEPNVPPGSESRGDPDVVADLSEPSDIPSFGASETTQNEEVESTPGAGRIVVVGDSVVLGASLELARLGDRVLIDGEIGRQWRNVGPDLDSLAQSWLPNDVVVLFLGNNGGVDAELFDDVMRTVGDVPVVVVTVSAPRSWESSVNEEIRLGVARWPQAHLADWHQVAEGHPEFFVSDGVHLQPPGQRALRDLLAEVIAEATIGSAGS